MRLAKSDVRGSPIVNAASITGLAGNTECNAYCASKHAVTGITKAVAGRSKYGKQGESHNSSAPAYSFSGGGPWEGQSARNCSSRIALYLARYASPHRFCVLSSLFAFPFSFWL
jgi:NAD(P)-dependent dehydrogenase (short-subunit alcohol dehydrogenase family)